MLNRLSIAVALLACTAAARAQTSFPELEPNNSKAQATIVNCLTAGDSLTGTTLGLSSGAGAASLDEFRVQTCAAPAGIYAHRLTLTTAGPAGHTGSLRGLAQATHVIAATTDVTFQASSTTVAPIRANTWYGFGKQEEIYYRVTGGATTTAAYTSTLTTTTTAAIAVIGAFTAGPITIDCSTQTVEDTELWLYDANFDAIVDAGSDEPMPPATVTGRPAKLVRTLAPGTYFVAVSDYNLANSFASPLDDASDNENVLDFPDALANAFVTPSPVDCSFTISDGVTTQVVSATKTANHEVIFAQFTVSAPPPAFTAFCAGDGTLTDHTTPCPCANDGAPGNGCGHSFDAGGANLSASGTAAADDVLLHSQFEPATSFTLFIQHDALGDQVFHDGVLCAGGSLVRLRGRAAVGGEAFFPNSLFANDSTLTLSQRGGVTVGSGARRYYAAWFRNASTTFCPPATANVSNGWMVDW